MLLAVMLKRSLMCFRLQANLAVQEARYEAAMKDLNKAQDQLDEKEKELEAVQAQYDQAMSEKQVFLYLIFCIVLPVLM